MKRASKIMAITLLFSLTAVFTAVAETDLGTLEVEVTTAKVKAAANENKINALAGGLPALEARVEALETTGGSVGPQGKPGYFVGLISATPYEDCLKNEDGFMCDKKQSIIVGVPLHYEANIDATQVWMIQVDGEPVPIEETVKMTFTNLPLPDGSGYEIAVVMRKGELSHNFTVAPDYPYYAINQPGGGFRFRASLVTDSQVAINMNADSVKNVVTESLGSLEGLPGDEWPIERSDEGDQDIILHVSLQNYGDLRTAYVVTVEDQALSGGMDLATSQWVMLSPGEQFTFDFELHNPNGFPSVPALKVQLWSPSGRLYDEFFTN